MVKDFGSEAQAVNGSTQAAFSNYKVDFVKPDSRSSTRYLLSTMYRFRMGRSSRDTG